MKLFALILFVLTYALMIALPKHRPWVALTSAVVFLVSGIVPLASLREAIDFNVLLMLAGTMGTVSLFIQSQMPNRMAEMILKKTPNVMWVAVAMSLFAGVVSAFVDNVATVLMIAPVGLAIAKKLGISPVAMLISIAVSSNLQGAATLVGDTTSIMLGGYAGMDFLDFFFMDGKASIFFAVELGALATVPVIMFLFRKHREPVNAAVETAVTDYFPTFLLLANIVLLITASFIPGKPALTNGFICTGLFLVGAVQSLIRGRGDRTGAKTALLEIDYQTLCLLAGLFVVIAGITNAGIIDEISSFFVKLGGNNLFLLYTVIVWGSVLISAFVDNIPYVATMLPVVSGIAPAHRRDAWRQPYAHRRIREHCHHRNSAQGGIRGQHGRLHAHRHSLHACCCQHRVSVLLACLALTLFFRYGRSCCRGGSFCNSSQPVKNPGIVKGRSP